MMIMDNQIKIELIEFDCGFLAKKVGKIHFDPKIYHTPNFEIDCIAQIKNENYSFCYITSETSFNFNNFESFGGLDSYRAELSDFNKILNNYLNIKCSGTYSTFDERFWEEIERLLDYCWKTRFWKDSRIPRQQVIRHKMKSLMYYQKKFPDLFKVFIRDSQIQGFLCSYVDDNKLHLYEFVLNPAFVLPLSSVYLLNSLLLSKSLKNINFIETRIYEDNIKMINFCKKSGFKKVKREYFYHYWAN
jgi:hypothetical protein